MHEARDTRPDFPRLFEPGRIGAMELKNRAVMAPMATDLADTRGVPTPRQVAYYRERAKGGVGLVVVEYTGVDDEDSIPSIHNLRAARDYHTSELEKLADAVHLYDCRIVAQIHHGGATSNPALTGRQNIAPSAVPIADGRPVPREMTLEDIRRVQDKFVEAAARCAKAGFDGVELHGAHGYLIAQFLSKYYNRRRDEYGGSVENRCRFVTQIVARIRERLGRFPVLVRMCGDEMTPVEGFLTLEDGLEVARCLEAVGIDALDVSNGSARNADANCEPPSYRFGWKRRVSSAYRQALSIPVIATGTVKKPWQAEELLEEGACDFVALGRSQLADPQFMAKAATGRADEVRGCIACLHCRERVIGQAMPIRCSVNPRAGREDEFAEEGLRARSDGAGRAVAVVGGGPAGMEAAIVLARRGFAPVLLERGAALGGTLRVADKPPFAERIGELAQSMARELEALGVDVRLGVEATPELVAGLDPWAVVVAVGAEPLVPGDVPGIGRDSVCTAEAVLLGERDPQGTVAVVGSGLTGLETAGLLAARGRRLVLVSRSDELGRGVFGPVRNDVLARVMPSRPEVRLGQRLAAVEDGCVVLEGKADGARSQVACDSVVLALGVRPRAETVEAFRAAFPRVRAVGDARRGRRIVDAVREGFEAGWTC